MKGWLHGDNDLNPIEITFFELKALLRNPKSERSVNNYGEKSVIYVSDISQINVGIILKQQDTAYSLKSDALSQTS